MAETPRSVSVEHQLVIRTVTSGSFAGPLANQFAAISVDRYFPAGTVIYRRGEAPEHIFILLEGRVQLSQPDEEDWYLQDSAVFGVFDAELERPHDRTARADTDVRAILIPVGEWFDLQEDHFEVVPPRIRVIAEGLWKFALEMDPPGGFDHGPPLSERPSMMVVLPSDDPRALNPFERLITLRLCPVFERAGMQSLIRLAREAHPRIFEAGQVLATRGSAATSFFIVVCGEVMASRDDPEIAVPFGAPEIAGRYAGFGQERWEVNLAATARTCCLEISYDALFDVMEDHNDLVRAVMAHLTLERERLQRIAAPR